MFEKLKKMLFETPEERTVFFGGIDKPLPDWRKDTSKGEDDDNDEDNSIEPDVLSILGFDPDKE